MVNERIERGRIMAKHTHKEIMRLSAKARLQAKQDSGIWAEGTKYTPTTLESLYEDHVVIALEAGEEPKSFEEFCEQDLGIRSE